MRQFRAGTDAAREKGWSLLRNWETFEWQRSDRGGRQLLLALSGAVLSLLNNVNHQPLHASPFARIRSWNILHAKWVVYHCPKGLPERQPRDKSGGSECCPLRYLPIGKWLWLPAVKGSSYFLHALLVNVQKQLEAGADTR